MHKYSRSCCVWLTTCIGHTGNSARVRKSTVYTDSQASLVNRVYLYIQRIPQLHYDFTKYGITLSLTIHGSPLAVISDSARGGLTVYVFFPLVSSWKSALGFDLEIGYFQFKGEGVLQGSLPWTIVLCFRLHDCWWKGKISWYRSVRHCTLTCSVITGSTMLCYKSMHNLLKK